MLIQVLAERTPPKANATDAALERETTVTWTDADTVMVIGTSQARVVTQLKNNPSATLIETDGKNFIFELPVGLLTFRNGKRTAGKKVVARKGRPANITLCGEPTAKGTPCQGIAKNDTGKCAKHS